MSKAGIKLKVTILTKNFLRLFLVASYFFQVMKDLPPTSYAKMIDIWLLFCLCVPFLQVLVYTRIERLRLVIYLWHSRATMHIMTIKQKLNLAK